MSRIANICQQPPTRPSLGRTLETLPILWQMRGEVQRLVTTKMTAVCGVAPPISKRFESRRL